MIFKGTKAVAPCFTVNMYIPAVGTFATTCGWSPVSAGQGGSSCGILDALHLMTVQDVRGRREQHQQHTTQANVSRVNRSYAVCH